MDKDLELAVSNPTEYLLKPQTKTNWDMSIEDASRAVSYNPAEVLLTKAEREPKSYGWVKTVLTNLGRGAESLFNAETGEQALTEIYTSPHMPKEQADRLIEDMAYARYAGRMSERAVMPKGEQLAEDKYPVTTTLSQGFGQFFAQTLTGMANPAAAWSSLYSTMQGEMEEGLIGKYVEETGGIEGYADRKRMDDTLTGGYAAINTLIERGLGAERIIERAFHNPTRTGLKNAVEQILDPKRFLAKQALKQAGKQALKTGLSENIEEFTQEYVSAATETAAGYKTLAELFSDEQLQKAMIAGAYGQIIGMAGGFGLHTANRIAIKKRVNEWAKEKGIQLSDNQLTQIANELIDSTQEQLVDHVTTTAEIQNHYGQAYELVKQRITEQIDATGTTPWTDQNKSKDEYIQTLADSITIPAINMANVLNIPLSEFLEIADINTATIAGNVAWLQPITNVEDIDKIISDQDAVIKQEREAKKLGVDDETKLKRARTRKAIAERVRKQIIGEQTLRTIRQNRKKENADYVTARDLQPEQINTLENAVQATGDQDYVLFGGIRIPVEYQVVELATIQPSHINGTPNPAYSNIELQNRASRGTTQDVADLREKATNITPERLMRASTSAEGAPVVNEKGEVIAGNGREEIIRYAYENPETAEKYKQELVKQGFNIEGMQQPILVRRNTTMTDQEQIAAADISNISETSAFDNASQARRDTQYLKDSKTPIEFASKLPMSERRGLMQNNGKWNKRKVQQRYEDALLAWLCGNDTQLFENLVLDRGLSQKVIDILATNGTLIYETATKYPDTELREDIYHALVKMQRATRDNFLETTQQLELDGHDVMPENIIIWNWLFTDTTTNRQFLQSYATTLANNHESVNTGEDMFGQKVAPLSKKDALIQALKKADQAKAETMAARGRDYAPLFDENGMATDLNLAAAIASYNNQFAPVNTDNQLSQEILQQFDLADENARLDDIYPAYDGETINIDGKERTVYNSNGERIAQSEPALRNFYKWFGDSKVVDEQGRPLVMYHGTTETFDRFFSDSWIYATTDKAYATRYTADDNDVEHPEMVMPLYIRASNPLDLGQVHGEIDEQYLESLRKKMHVTKAEIKQLVIATGNEGYYRGVHTGRWELTNTPQFWTFVMVHTGFDSVMTEETDEGIKGFAVMANSQVKSTDNRGTFSLYDSNIYYQKRGVIRGQYDPELQAILLTKYWNETTLVHEYHHRFLEKLWGYFKQAQTGERAVSDEFLADMDKLFQMLEIDPAQDKLTVVQQEKFATMVEAYLTGLGVDNPENLAFQSFLHWIPEQYKSIMDLGYLDENNEIQNPILDQESIDWFNKWFACPFAPSLPSAPDAQRIINPTDKTGQIVPSSQKIMNNREKEWGQDSEEQNKADAQLWRAINENTPNDMRAALDGEKVNMKAATNNLPDDTKLPEPHKPTLRDKWFKTYQPDARERAADMAREYLAQNPEHARELAFADPETMAEFDAPVDHGMLIRAVMETVPHGSDEWYILNDNLATVKSMSGSTLSLSGDLSHQAYLDAKREVEAARELKAAVNYAGTRRGAMDKWNSDIRAFIAQRTEALLATEPDSEERKTAIKAFLEEAKTKFSANTTDSVLNQLDLTGIKTKNSQVFIKWAEKQIKQAAHAKIDANEQKELIKASIAAQLAMKEIDSTVQKDGKYTRAVQSAKDIRHWQFVKDKMKKAYIGRWGKFGIFWDNLFGSYAPSAMLMSANTLFFANVPSTAINTGTIRLSALTIGKNKVDKATQKGEIERIKQIFNASGVNLAQMEKPTSPSTLHGEKYTKSEQSHWYDFTFEILGRTDNIFRIPTFVDALARIATKNAGGDKTKATVLFKEYAKLNNQSDEAKIARKQALAVANMAVFTQDGTLATGLNQIRTVLNTISRVPLGLEPQGFGLGNILAPFLKTGANITEMGFDAMLAPIRTVATGLQKLQGKEIPDIKKLAITSDWINLAWTSVMIALMAAISSDDDEWYTEPYTSGRRYDPDKPYDSIKIGGIWVKMDIFGPVAIPLRTAAMTIKDWEDKKLASIGDGMYEALSDTPLVQQFTDSSLDYMSKQPEKYWSSFGYNQANKLVPAQVKSLTKATSRATGATLETDWLGTTIDRKFHRNYGFDSARLTTNDLINILTNRLKYTEQ